MTYRPAFTQALNLLARAFNRMEARSLTPPILVGGAAVELITGGEVATGDFDLVTPHQTEIEEELKRLGFESTRGEIGQPSRGLLHRDLGIGVEVVSSRLMDGRAERDRVWLMEIGDAGRLAIIPIEDLIADRLGQALSVPGHDVQMLQQATMLYKLAEALDESYLDRRIREETAGKADLAFLRRAAG